VIDMQPRVHLASRPSGHPAGRLLRALRATTTTR
jgi:hypothetical protein